MLPSREPVLFIFFYFFSSTTKYLTKMGPKNGTHVTGIVFVKFFLFSRENVNF